MPKIKWFTCRCGARYSVPFQRFQEGNYPHLCAACRTSRKLDDAVKKGSNHRLEVDE